MTEPEPDYVMHRAYDDDVWDVFHAAHGQWLGDVIREGDVWIPVTRDLFRYNGCPTRQDAAAALVLGVNAPPAVTFWPGKCVECDRRRPVARCQRFGGGSYRRGGRWFYSSICARCVHELAARHAQDPRTHGNLGGRHWSRAGILRLAELRNPA